jgi:hypothetical protein
MLEKAGPAAAVAVVVVSYGSADDVRALIDALDRQTFPPATIHICENGGEAAFGALTARLTEAFGGGGAADPRRPGRVATTTVLPREKAAPVHCHRATANLGYAGGINAVIQELAPGEWSAIWIVNPDATPEPEALAALVKELGRKDIGVVGGRIVYAETGRLQLDGGVWRKWVARGLNINLDGDPAAPVDAKAVEKRMDYVSGACMLVKRDYVERVGLMDESYFLYCEEVDWCARRGGYGLAFAPDALIRHGHGTTIGSHRDRRRRSRLSIYLDERNRLLFTQRHHSGIFPLVLMTTLLLQLQYLRHGAFVSFWHGLAGWLAGVRGETGPPPWFAGAAPSPAVATQHKAPTDG